MNFIFNKFFQPIRRWLDQTAMYRTVSLFLVALVIYSLILGFLGRLPYTGFEQLVSLGTALAAALIFNVIFSYFLRIKVNNESAFITALIVFFVVIPPFSSKIVEGLIPLIAAVFLSIASKFFLVYRKQHIFNPAAIGVVLLMVIYALFPTLGYFEPVWWIGTPEMFWPLLIAGTLVVFKIRKWEPVLAFLGAGFLAFIFKEWWLGFSVLEKIPNFWLSGPSLFLAFFMLTEPFTMPPTKRYQIWYGALVGVLSQAFYLADFIKITPEVALVLGNLAFYFSTLRQKLILPLVKKTELTKNTIEFSFAKPKNMTWQAGQYLEWMLPHQAHDNRGIRRYFTIASAPQDDFLKIGVRFGEGISTYKTKLKSLEEGDTIIASQLTGDFVLPKSTSAKVAFVAGGIGITPFISQLESMQNEKRYFDTVLFYGNNTRDDIAYADRLEVLAKNLPLKIINILNKETVPGYETGFLTVELIKRTVPDFAERTWFISGPPLMVENYTRLLLDLGISSKRIKKDFFPGLA